MNARVTPALFSFSARFFVVFLALTVWAFWPSYFARLFEQPNVWFHAHGIVLALWLAMLVAQAQLIRTQRRSLHRQLGKLSYVLAPAVVVITTVFVHQRVAGSVAGLPTLPPMALHFLALTLLSLVGFAVFYGLAIARRRDSQTHARWTRPPGTAGVPQMQEQFAACARCSRWSRPSLIVSSARTCGRSSGSCRASTAIRSCRRLVLRSSI